MRLAIWATVIVAVPFALTGAVIMGSHFLGGRHETVSVNWTWCAATGVGLAVAWLVTQRRRVHRTP